MKDLLPVLTLLLTLGSGVAAADTIFSTEGSDIRVAGNWSNGLPASGNPGTIALDGTNGGSTIGFGSGSVVDHSAGTLTSEAFNLISGTWNISRIATHECRFFLSNGAFTVVNFSGGTIFLRDDLTGSKHVGIANGGTLRVSGTAAIDGRHASQAISTDSSGTIVIENNWSGYWNWGFHSGTEWQDHFTSGRITLEGVTISNATQFDAHFGVSPDGKVLQRKYVVKTISDSGAGSLRQTIADAPAGQTIYFAPQMNGGTIQLAGSALTIDKNLTIDASTLPNGITIDAAKKSGVMAVGSGRVVALHCLTLTGGSTVYGGAILATNADLSLTGCTLSGNNATNSGGAIAFISNSSVQFTPSLNLGSCTLSGNSASQGGGGLSCIAQSVNITISLTGCTLSENSASQGGGIQIANTAGSASLSLQDTLLAGNYAPTGPDLSAAGATITATGKNLLSSLDGSGLPAGGNVIVTSDPMLAPLGNYGGPTQTMHPLAGSPALLSGADTSLTDQRGFEITGPPTIGAVKIGPTATVANTADSGGGSLRKAIADNATTPGAVIRFASALSGKTLPLSTAQLEIPGTARGLFIDASGLPGGFTIDAQGSEATPRRVLELKPGSSAALDGLTFTGGWASGTLPADRGGAIYLKNATLSLSACVVSDNVASGDGGGIYSDGSEGSASLSLSDCTLAGNSAANGGGIGHYADNAGKARLSLTTSTLAGNSATNLGGGFFSSSVEGGNVHVSLSACTLAGNSATTLGGGIISNGNEAIAILSLSDCTLSGNFAPSAGGIANLASNGGSASLGLHNTLLAGNSASTGPDLFAPGTTITPTGKNLLSSIGGSGLTEGENVILDPDPKLFPLGWFGGPTQTMHPMAGSPAVLTGAHTTRTGQRGFPLTGPPTIGAVKLGPVTTVANTADSGADSLRKAIADNATTPGAVIRFASGLSGQTLALSTAQLEIPSTARWLFIDASGLPGGFTIDAQGSEATPRRVLELKPGSSAALHGLTFTGGWASGTFPADRGGAIYLKNASLILSACTLSGNSAGSAGGGIYSNGSDSGNASLSLSTCTLSGNSADFGGGISSDGFEGSASLSLSACTLSGNSAEDSGGAILSNGFEGSASLSLSACTLSGNSAGNAGGGIYSYGNAGSASLSLSACTLSGNSAGNAGGGIYSNGGSSGSAAVNLHNTLLAGNAAPTGPDLREFGAGAVTTATGQNLLSSIAGSNISNSPLPSSITVVADPLLSPLGWFGGPTQTLHPLPFSPAVDAAGTTNPGGTDARGFNRFVNGSLDIGAVEVGLIRVVTNDNDADAGSLRQAILDSATSPGAVIRFDSGLSGHTLALSSGQLEIPGTARGLFIDASGLPGGFTIDAQGSEATPRRVLELKPGSSAALHGLTFTGGLAVGRFLADRGGAIYLEHASLNLSACTLSGNFAKLGGGIYSEGSEGSASLNLTACTLSGNSASFVGGGIVSNGSFSGNASLSLSACTLSGNSASFLGGGIYSTGGTNGSASLSLSACTLSGNSAGNAGGGIYSEGSEGSASLSLSACTLSGNTADFGGGIYSDGSSSGSATLSLHNTILTGNAAPTGPDLREFGEGAVTTATGQNLLSSIAGSNISASPLPSGITVAADPLLSPLGWFGGPTQTLHPLAGSPAILDQEPTTTRTDQRGFSLNGPPTIGAVKLGPVSAVNNTGDDAATATTLRHAMANVTAPGSVIRFDTAVFQGAPEHVITLTNGQLATTGSTPDGLFIDASNIAAGVTLNANQDSRILQVAQGTTLALHGLTMTNGNGTADGITGTDGGAVRNLGTLSAHQCRFSNNQAVGHGGAISNSYGGSVQLVDCVLAENESTTVGGNSDGGAIRNGGEGARITILRSAFHLNNAGRNGGAIFNQFHATDPPRVTVEDSTFSSNISNNNGGAVFNQGDASGYGHLAIHGSTFNGNQTKGAGGAIQNQGTLTMNHSTVHANTTSGNGGGLHNQVVAGGPDSGVASLDHVTLTSNTAGTDGTGVGAGLHNLGTLSLKNSILADNHNDPSGANAGQDLSVGGTTVATHLAGVNLIETALSFTPDTSGDSVLNGSPLLAPLGDYGGPTQTMPPLPGSPAIDAAGTTDPGGTDQRGFPRFVNGDLDIGAVEFSAAADLAPIWSTNTDGDSNAYGIEFALGTDADANDPAHAHAFRITGMNGSGKPTLTFGLNPTALEYTSWIVKRSTTLMPNSWSEIYRYHGPTMMETATGTTATPMGALLEVVDDNPPPGGAFYLFEAEVAE